MKRSGFSVVIFLIAGLFAGSVFSQSPVKRLAGERTVRSLNSSWKFSPEDKPVFAGCGVLDDSWQNVTLPRTWNDKDTLDDAPGFGNLCLRWHNSCDIKLTLTYPTDIMLKKKQVTLSDIAARSGVATMTVSRVVNGSGYVSEETRKKVQAAVIEMNYRRNGLARNLKRQRTETVGLVLGDLSNPYSTELANAVRESLSFRGYNLFICISEHSAREDIAAFESLVDHNVDGIIVATRSNQEGDARLESIANSNLPIVVVGRDFKHGAVDYVSADNFTGGLEATRHLIDLGHRRIAFIGAGFESRSSLKRLQGYLKALEMHDIAVDERLITGRKESASEVPGYSTEKIGYEAMKRLLSLPAPPTAVFARNDFTAVGAISAIKEVGLSIPQDIAIVGFDDTPLAIHTMPALTTVRQPMRLQGQLAAQMLLRRISNEKVIDREERILDCELIVRESTVPSHV